MSNVLHSQSRGKCVKPRHRFNMGKNNLQVLGLVEEERENLETKCIKLVEDILISKHRITFIRPLSLTVTKE